MKTISKVYLYFILSLVIIIPLLAFFLNYYFKFEEFNKLYFVWFVIILELNVINYFLVIRFYEKHRNRKGPKGPKGDKGPRGFKGVNDKCSSCGLAGANQIVYGGTLNDKGQKLNNKMVKQGKCIFPFLDDYKYQYQCQKTKTPLGTDDANIGGWCATSLNEDKTAKTFAFCNENESIKDQIAKDNFYLQQRQDYINKNSGILDIDIVAGNTELEAKEKCNKPDYQVYDQDLNEKSDGKFIYMCYKKGIGGIGISNLHLNSLGESEVDPEKTLLLGEDETKYKLIDQNLNQGSLGAPVYLYKQTDNTDFIKDFKIVKDDVCPEDYEDVSIRSGSGSGPGPTRFVDLNLDDDEDTPALRLCISRTAMESIQVDFAFVYKNGGALYFFSGEDFYKLSKIPVQSSLKAIDGYPKKVNDVWFKASKCNNYSEETECNNDVSCIFRKEEDSELGTCNEKSFSAGFTYKYDNKTYFFKGNDVFLYNDSKRRVADGFPKKIEDVFKGIPGNIDAVFTWGKDSKTYFFKGPLYYKYNDSKGEVEPGYPKRTKLRWPNMPSVIDAIFTLDFSLDNLADKNPTYVISGGKSYYINNITDKVENEKPVSERFKLIDESSIPTISSSLTTSVTSSN